MKFITYWEQNSFKNAIPSYILCGIASMKKAFKDDFLLLDKNNISKWIDFDFTSKDFYFASSQDKKFNQISRIVAKSDFIRMKFILKHGGFWIDADSIILRNMLPEVIPLTDDEKLAWHSEQFFGASSGNKIVQKCVENMLSSQRQIYGNPGEIKELVKNYSDTINLIPSTLYDPTSSGGYSARTWDVITKAGDVDDFLSNKHCALIKMYNSVFCKLDLADMSVENFLKSDSLLAKIFLYIDSNIDSWVSDCALIEAEILD